MTPIEPTKDRPGIVTTIGGFSISAGVAQPQERTVRSEPRDTPSGPPSQPEVGTCFGYRVRSAFALKALRGGGGTPLQVIENAGQAPSGGDTPLLHWFDEAGNEVAEVYAEDGRFGVRIEDVGWFDVDPSTPSVAAPRNVRDIRGEARLWGIPAVLCFLDRGDLALHAAAVEVDGSALLLAAPGRYGKTTLAGGFLRAGHRLLSEDVSCCSAEDGSSILPGPAMLRVRRDMYAELEFPGTEVAGEDAERIFLTLEQPARGDGSPVPIRGVVFLRRSNEAMRMERLPRERVVQDLWALSLNLPTDESRARCFQHITALAAQVPVWNLHRRLAVDQLGETVERIIATCLP